MLDVEPGRLLLAQSSTLAFPVCGAVVPKSRARSRINSQFDNGAWLQVASRPPSAINFVSFSNSGAAQSAPAENLRSPTRPYRDSKPREAMPSSAE